MSLNDSLLNYMIVNTPTRFAIEKKLEEINTYGGCVDFIMNNCNKCGCCEFEKEIE